MNEVAENDESRVTWEQRGNDIRPTTDRKVLRFGETLLKQLGKAVNALTRHVAPEPEPARRNRSDETRGSFGIAARKIVRPRMSVSSTFHAATDFLWDTLDWLNPWHMQDTTGADDFDQEFQQFDHDQLYPHL